MDMDTMEAVRTVLEYAREIATHPAHEDIRTAMGIIDTYLDGDNA